VAQRLGAARGLTGRTHPLRLADLDQEECKQRHAVIPRSAAHPAPPHPPPVPRPDR
jgi:hypothetical protein